MGQRAGPGHHQRLRLGDAVDVEQHEFMPLRREMREQRVHRRTGTHRGINGGHEGQHGWKALDGVAGGNTPEPAR